MDLRHAVLDYAAKNINSLARNYQRVFTLDALAVNIDLTGKNWLEKNINLRNALHEQWTLAPPQREHLVKWYVREWGGIRTNSSDTLARYSTIHPRQLISRREVGIASWSKALSIIDPQNFAIYDARIAVALHSLQIIKSVKNPVYFPDLNSRHSAIKPIVQAGRKRLKPYWSPVHKPTFYENYNALLKDVAVKIGNCVTLQTMEILLSSHALMLAREWMQDPAMLEHHHHEQKTADIHRCATVRCFSQS